jgi:hypothetical protein
MQERSLYSGPLPIGAPLKGDDYRTRESGTVIDLTSTLVLVAAARTCLTLVRPARPALANAMPPFEPSIGAALVTAAGAFSTSFDTIA